MAAPHTRGGVLPSTTLEPTNIISPLLKLPRELRNCIYDYTTVACRVSKPQSPGADETDIQPSVLLIKTTNPALLQVCRQIHNECLEYIRPRATLFVQTTDCDLHLLRPLEFKPAVPLEALSVKKCLVALTWTAVCSTSQQDALLKFFTEHTPEQLVQQEQLPTTPSKRLRDKFKELLTCIGPLVNSAASVQLCILLDMQPNPADPYSWFAQSPEDPTTDEFMGAGPASKVAHMFHMGTFSRLEQDTTISWPAQGKLSVFGMLRTPLFCTLAKNGKELKANHEAFLRGETEELIRPVCKVSRQSVCWHMHPTESENNWRGYWPEFRGVPPRRPGDVSTWA